MNSLSILHYKGVGRSRGSQYFPMMSDSAGHVLVLLICALILQASEVHLVIVGDLLDKFWVLLVEFFSFSAVVVGGWVLGGVQEGSKFNYNMCT